MKAHDFAVTGDVEVSLDAVRALLPRQLEGGQGILRGLSGGAAMGHEEGSGEGWHCRHQEGWEQKEAYHRQGRLLVAAVRSPEPRNH